MTESEYLSFILILIQRRVQTRIMYNEKFQDTDRATGLDEIACDTPGTPPPLNQSNDVNNAIVVPPHR